MHLHVPLNIASCTFYWWLCSSIINISYSIALWNKDAHGNVSESVAINNGLYSYSLYVSIILFFTFFLFWYASLVSEFGLLMICCFTHNCQVNMLQLFTYQSGGCLPGISSEKGINLKDRVSKALQAPISRLINDILQISFQSFSDKCW